MSTDWNISVLQMQSLLDHFIRVHSVNFHNFGFISDATVTKHLPPHALRILTVSLRVHILTRRNPYITSLLTINVAAQVILGLVIMSKGGFAGTLDSAIFVT